MVARIAAIQFDPHLADAAYNLRHIEDALARAVRAGVQLAVFPECAVSGYLYNSLDEALAIAEPIPGPASEQIARATAEFGVYAVVGMLERAGGRCYNSAVLSGPGGIEAVYRKTHTLCLGVDRFTTPGDIPYQVHSLPFGRIGILICYDLRFPEPARALALLGAQAIALPTNWPASSTIQPDVFTRSRAAENRVFILAANRCGVERGSHFLGRSQVVSPDGDVIDEAPLSTPAMLIQDVDLTDADRKHVVVRPGAHEMDPFADRRPEMYNVLLRESSQTGALP